MIDARHVCFDAAPRSAARPAVRAGKGLALNPSQRPNVVRKADANIPLDPLLKWLLTTAALNPAAYRASALQRRLGACLRSLRVKTTEEAQHVLELHPHLRATALSTALIGVTEFFRDPGVFALLRTDILPELLRRNPALRVLSAGCSGGHELYSIAMLLDEAGVLDKSELVGIDCRSAAIDQASAGVYDAHDVAGLPDRERDFRQSGRQWQICDRLKLRTHWHRADLMTHRSTQLFELVLYRNVAIYLNSSHAEETWERISTHVAPGGYLITGKAEQPPARLRLTRVSPCIHLKPQTP